MPLQGTVAAQGRAACQAGSSSQLPQARPHVPRQHRPQSLLPQPWLWRGLGGWGWFQLDRWWHSPQRDPGKCLASWWLPQSSRGGRIGCHHPCVQAGLEPELGPSPVKLEVLGSEECGPRGCGQLLPFLGPALQTPALQPPGQEGSAQPHWKSQVWWPQRRSLQTGLVRQDVADWRGEGPQESWVMGAGAVRSPGWGP